MGLKNESRMYSNGYCFWRCRKNIENAKNKISEAMKESKMLSSYQNYGQQDMI